MATPKTKSWGKSLRLISLKFVMDKFSYGLLTGRQPIGGDCSIASTIGNAITGSIWLAQMMVHPNVPILIL